MARINDRKINGFRLARGRVLADRYEIVSKLGAGWEGEVYLVRETATGIERTAKLFYPQRNVRDRALKFYARKLHKLRSCPLVIQYHTQDSFVYAGTKISFLISEYVEGELLSKFLKRQPGGRLTPFQAVHLLHALATGIEQIHALGDYHGDLHSDNIIVQRLGLGFDLRILDMLHWGPPSGDNFRHDLECLIRIFHESLGGAARYRRLPPEVKFICCGLKNSLIRKRFRSARTLRAHIETMEWG